MFFSEEKNQKTLIRLVRRPARHFIRPAAGSRKSLASFLQKRRPFLSAATALLLTASPSIAQHAIGIGTRLSAADLAHAYSVPPGGAGLPPGSGTPAQGAAVYAQFCVACHGDKLQGQKTIGAPALIGGRGTLTRVPVPGAPPANLPVKTVESYWPYATTLFDYIRRAMPMNAPGSLTDDQVYSVSAYILARGNIVPQDAVLDAKTLPGIHMPNRNGFTPEYPPASARRR